MIQYLVNGLFASSWICMIAIGFGLIHRVCGFLSFSHGLFVAVGAYGTFVAQQSGAPIWVCLLFSSFLICALSGLIWLLVIAPIARRERSSFEQLIATMGVYVTGVALLSMIFGPGTTMLRGGWLGSVDFGFFRMTGLQLSSVLLAIGTSFTIWIVISRANIGSKARAIADDPALALIVGLPVESIRSATFATGAVLAGLAGAILAFDAGARPTMGMQPLIVGVVAALIGRGMVLPTVGASLLIGLIQQFAVIILPSAWKEGILFAVLLAYLLGKELFHKRPRLKNRWTIFGT